MFSETRYARNGDLRVAYRASREGPRDIVFVPTWFSNCEVVPELPSIQGWVEAMTSLGRLIFFDQPGTGDIAARVSAQAGPNDVLVSSTLRDLVIGSGLEFEDRGTHTLKGVPGEWRLFAVASTS